MGRQGSPFRRRDAGVASLRIAIAAMSLITVPFGSALAQDAPIRESASRHLELKYPNDLVVTDTIHNQKKTPEIILTDSEGRVLLLDGATLGSIREWQSQPPAGLTSAGVGDFCGRNRSDIAVGTQDGRVVFLEGSTLSPLAEFAVGQSAIVIQPTAVPVRRATLRSSTHEDQLPETSDIDLCVVADEGGFVHALYLVGGATPDEPWRVEKAWTRQISTGLSGPPSIGTVRSATSLDIVAAGRDGRVFLFNPQNGEVESETIKERERILGSPLVTDIKGADGLCEIVVTFETGELSLVEYSSVQAPRLRQTARVSVGGKPSQGPVLAAQIGTLQNRYVLGASNSRLVAADAANVAGWSLPVEDTRTLKDKLTEMALVPSATGVPNLVISTGKTLFVTTDFGGWIASAGTKPMSALELPLSAQLTGAIGLFASPDGKTLNIIAASPDATIRRFEANVPIAPWATQVLWETGGGSMWHNALNDIQYAKMRAHRQALAEAVALEKLNQLGDEKTKGNWDAALLAARWLQDFDPTEPSYVKLAQDTWMRKNLLTILLGTGASLALIGFVGWKTIQFVTRHRMMSRAAAAVQAREYAKARALYEKLLILEPTNPKVFVPLAHVYMAESDFSPKALPAYAKTYAISPDNKNLLHAYARALLLKPETSAEAEKIYEEAIPTFPEPQFLEYGLGCCYVARGDYESAGKRLRAAIRGGMASDSAYGALTDVYLKTKSFTAKSLPVFQHQFARRQESQEFLEAFLLASIDARRTDPEVETLCHQVLEGNPTFAPAFCHLCAIHLQKNQIGQAVEEARNALKHSPGDRQGVALLAHCYMVQSRRDDEALEAYVQALENEPDEPELLRMVTEIYHARGNYDARAVAIFKRSLAQSANDLGTLQALAQAALLTSDDALTVKSVEALFAQGQANPKLVRQLAQAYVRLKIREPRAERILREALRVEPRSAEYLQALSLVLVAQDRIDPEAVPTYEAYLSSSPTDLPVGRQLARAYMGQNRFEVALALVTRLLETSPQDEELKRLVALASLYGNKIDEAIVGYRRILSQNPSDEDALVNLALAYAQKRNVDDEAAALYQRAHQVRPDAEGISLAMARHSLSKGDQLKAVEWFQKALKARAGVEENVLAHVQDAISEFSDSLRVRWFLCELLVAFNRLREALEQLLIVYDSNPGQAKNVLAALDKILAKDPNNVAALMHKGRMLLASENAKQARRSLEKAHQLQPSNAEIQKALASTYEKILEEKEEVEVRFQLGKLHYQTLEFDKAIGCFQKTAQDYRWEAESAKALGKCFTAKGMLDLALQEYKKLVVDEETKDLLYDLAQRYEAKKDLVGAKTVYRQLFAADIDYKDVRRRFEMLSGSTSDPMAFEKTNIVQTMSEEASRRYELLDELGRGAMGIVYRARDKELEEVVALKILPDSMSNNPEAVRRFKIEARNARRISHPNIVRIHDIGEEMGRKYISMEYVDGSDLKKRVKGGPKMSMKEVLHFSIQIADALAYAHRLGIVHRDIKPANIMLTSTNDVKVTDFGIAKLMDQTAEGTMAGAVIGTPLYMSPEQVQGIGVDGRADIYSFGVMVYEFVNTRPPFTEGDLSYQHLHREPDPIAGCPEPLWAIIRKCLAKAKEDRWQTGDEIVAAMRQSRDAIIAFES